MNSKSHRCGPFANNNMIAYDLRARMQIECIERNRKKSIHSREFTIAKLNERRLPIYSFFRSGVWFYVLKSTFFSPMKFTYITNLFCYVILSNNVHAEANDTRRKRATKFVSNWNKTEIPTGIYRRIMHSTLWANYGNFKIFLRECCTHQRKNCRPVNHLVQSSRH